MILNVCYTLVWLQFDDDDLGNAQVIQVKIGTNDNTKTIIDNAQTGE